MAVDFSKYVGEMMARSREYSAKPKFKSNFGFTGEGLDEGPAVESYGAEHPALKTAKEIQGRAAEKSNSTGTTSGSGNQTGTPTRPRVVKRGLISSAFRGIGNFFKRLF